MRGFRVGEPYRPLALLLIAGAIVGIAWALLVPAWQAPDEPAHFGYAQTLAEQGRLPAAEGDKRFSTEQELAAEAVESDQLAANPLARPEWSEEEYERWRAQQAALDPGDRADGDGAGPEGGNSARTNPPLYYAYELVPYYVASAGDLFDRYYLMRIWSALLLLVAAAATWALVRELAPNRPLLQLVAAAVVALQPMAAFVGSSINPDALLVASFAVALWLGVRVICRGLTLAAGTALCAATAVAILTKATGYALVPGVLLALGLGAWRAGVGARVGSLARAALPLLALAVPVGAWLVYARASSRPAVNQVAAADAGIDHPGLFSYIWQFYLPHLPGQLPLPTNYPSLPALEFWLKGFWGKFGWLEIELPNALFAVLGTVTALALIGALVRVFRGDRGRNLRVAAFLALVAATLVGGLHLTEYRILAGENGVFNQGRYLLPLVPVVGLACAAALSLLTRERWRAVGAGALVGLLFVAQVTALAVVGARFYA
ncbi:MAG: DUF2142 domain-containing protein [Solirubrobacterales bacterium]|nr:DUF2142 domain-containing protein [Solirubrobacterales bacterium]